MLPVPTPFTHLQLARELLPRLGPGARGGVEAHWGAFLLGNIAPDVQTISGQSREATHFFPVPLAGAPPAPRSLLRSYPALARRRALEPAHAAFVAGYLAHLVFDQRWISDIFEPVFGPQRGWGTFRERLYLHNVLRAHWDAADLARLPAVMGGDLHQAEPRGWLPFVTDNHLAAWRDLVDDQLGPGAPRTVEVFAARMQVDPAEFAALLASPAELERRLFSRLPRSALDAYRAKGLELSREVIDAYWAGESHFPGL